MNSTIDRRMWRDRLSRAGYLVAAVLLHVVLFLLVATYVVFKAPVKEETATFLRVAVPPSAPPAPAPPAPPPPSQDALNSVQPAVQATAPSAVPTIVATMSPSSFSVKSEQVSLPALPAPTAPPAPISSPPGTGLSGMDAPGQGSGGISSPFGSEVAGGTAQLQGYLYDLKQTPDHKPAKMDAGNYHTKLTQFVKANWDPAFLSQYYKSPKPLNTSSIFIPTISALDGPKAFGVDKEVQPNMYVVWYKVKAAPSQDGTYHFVGIADDILLVRVDGRTVLDGSLVSVDDDLRKKETQNALVKFHASCNYDGTLYVGTPFHASAGEPVEIDVLIGEQPGGYSNYFLYIQRDESNYQSQSNGTPLLPIFQLDSNPIHPAGKPLSYPPFSSNLEPWGAGSK